MPISLPCRPGRGLVGAQLGVIDFGEGFAERLFVIAGIVGEAGGGGVRKLVGVDEVLDAELHGVHLQFGGEEVHHASMPSGRFGASGAAIGVGGHAVGEDSDDVGGDVS